MLTAYIDFLVLPISISTLITPASLELVSDYLTNTLKLLIAIN